MPEATKKVYSLILLRTELVLKVVRSKFNKCELHIWLDVFVLPPGVVTQCNQRVYVLLATGNGMFDEIIFLLIFLRRFWITGSKLFYNK